MQQTYGPIPCKPAAAAFRLIDDWRAKAAAAIAAAELLVPTRGD